MGSGVIPANQISPTPVIGVFLPPENTPANPLIHTVRGGAALNDGSQGRDIKDWTASWAAGMITISTLGQPTVLTHHATGAVQIALSFDNNMAPILSWVDASAGHLWFFNSQTNAMDTLTIAGITSSRLCIDNVQGFYNQDSDVIYAYTLAGNLYWRQQRDRYAIERLVGATTGTITRLGLSIKNRLQFELTL